MSFRSSLQDDGSVLKKYTETPMEEDNLFDTSLRAYLRSVRKSVYNVSQARGMNDIYTPHYAGLDLVSIDKFDDVEAAALSSYSNFLTREELNAEDNLVADTEDETKVIEMVHK